MMKYKIIKGADNLWRETLIKYQNITVCKAFDVTGQLVFCPGDFTCCKITSGLRKKGTGYEAFELQSRSK
jgi:hypothetical protein